VLGQGGSATLVGALGGVGGEPAAALASAAGQPASYRFNNCPMGLANCGALPPGGGGEVAGGGGGGGGGASPIIPPAQTPAGLADRLLVPVPLLLSGLTQPPGGTSPSSQPGGSAPWSPSAESFLLPPPHVIAEEREAEAPR
jgi:hypothetical protein